MTSKDAAALAARYASLTLRNSHIFTALCIGFVVWIVASPDLHETEAYADVRKLLAIVFCVLAIPLMLATLKLMARMNAAARLAGELLQADAEAAGLFRPVSPLFALASMTTAIIIVTYIILIYAVDGGIF